MSDDERARALLLYQTIYAHIRHGYMLVEFEERDYKIIDHIASALREARRRVLRDARVKFLSKVSSPQFAWFTDWLEQQAREEEMP